MAIFGRRAQFDPSTLRARLVPHAGDAEEGRVVVSAGAFDVAIVRATDPTQTITHADAGAFGVELPALLTDSVEQTFRQELARLDVRDHTLSDGRQLRVLALDGSLYVTLALLAVRRWIDVPTALGAFVAAPTFDSVALYPLTVRRDTEVLAGMARVSAAIAAQSDNVCDPRVHWWDGRTFHAIEMLNVVGRNPVVGGPESLLAALDSLGTQL